MTLVSGGAEIKNNTLFFDGKPLDVRTHSEHHLRFVLSSLGRDAIVDGIEDLYKKTSTANPTAEEITRPSISVINLGPDAGVLSPLGYLNLTRVHRHVLEIQDVQRDYWDVVKEYGFTPEIRSRLGARAVAHSRLMLRNPETDPVPITPLDALPAALGFVEPSEIRELRPKLREAYAHNDPEALRALWGEVADENQAAVDRQFASIQLYGELSQRGAEAAVRVGRDIAEATLRIEIIGEDYLLDPDRYELALFDIHHHIRELSNEGDEDTKGYAYRMELDAVDEELKKEVERVRSLRG